MLKYFGNIFIPFYVFIFTRRTTDYCVLVRNTAVFYVCCKSMTAKFLEWKCARLFTETHIMFSPHFTAAAVISKFGCQTQATDYSTDTEVWSRPRTHFTQPVPLMCTLQSVHTLHFSVQTTAFWNNLALLYNIVWAKIPRAPVEKGCCPGFEVGGPINKTLYVAYVTFPTHSNRQYCTFYVTSTLT